MLNQQVVTYGSYTFPNLGIGFSAKAEFDGTNRVLQGYTLTFHGVCYLVDTTSAGLQAKIAAITQVLNTPRLQFLWVSGGTTIWNITAAGVGGTLEDRRWGPKPQMVGTPSLIGGCTAKVTFEISTFVAFCPSGYGAGDVEEFWQTESYSLNANFAVTRTVAGQYRVKSSLNAASKWLPDGTQWPTLPYGFRRTSVQHTLNNDGTILTFSIVDTQVYRTLPAPLTDGNAVFSIHCSKADITKTLTGSFEAPTDTNKNIIVQFIMALVRARFSGAWAATVSEWITDWKITNHEFENKVDFSVTSKAFGGSVVTGSSAVGNSLAVLANGWGDVAATSGANAVVPYAGDGWTPSNGVAQLKGMVGTGGLIPGPQPLFAVCGETYSPYNDQYNSGAISNTSGTNSSSTPGDTGEQGTEATANFSSGQQSNPITSYMEQWSYIVDPRVIRIPLTTGGTASTASDNMQRTALPKVTLFQVGKASRLGLNPVFPAPAPVGSSSDTNYVTCAERRLGTPKMNGDGNSVEYTISWAYTIECPGVQQMGDASSSTTVNLNPPLSPLYSTSFNAQVGGSVQATAFPAIDGSYTP